MSTPFKYNEAFSRNIGLLTPEEQAKIRTFTIAIPGMGGVGGAHLISFVRQGFEKFKIADLDTYEVKNTNRQYGANCHTINQEKVAVMKAEALKINPHCKIETFNQGISNENIDDFLSGVDLSIDAIDAFTVDMRRLFINKSLEKNIPAITAGPIGFGTAFLIFMPGGPTYDDYFDINDKTDEDKHILSFMIGLVPSLLQRTYMKKTSLKERRGPSSIGAVNLCAGVSVIQGLKILLQKGNIKPVPYYHQFDLYRDIYVSKRLWFGNKNPIQKLKMFLTKHILND